MTEAISPDPETAALISPSTASSATAKAIYARTSPRRRRRLSRPAASAALAEAGLREDLGLKKGHIHWDINKYRT